MASSPASARTCCSSWHPLRSPCSGAARVATGSSPPRPAVSVSCSGSYRLPCCRGGLPAYLRATLQQGAAASGEASPFTHGLAGFAHNARTLAIFLWRGLYVAALPLAYYGLRRVLLRRVPDPALPLVLLWLTPPLAYYLLGHLGDYGYTFSLLPALLLLAARGTILAARDLRGLGIMA